jgi:hypothetical protein
MSAGLSPNHLVDEKKRAIVRLRRNLNTTNERLLLAGLRPSSLNASGLIGVGRSSTLSNLLSYLTADTRDEARG